MSDDYTGKQLKLWTSATYCIEVEGQLDDSWSDRLAGKAGKEVLLSSL